MKPCLMRHPVSGPVAAALNFIGQPPAYLSCDREADHEGPHHDPSGQWWQFSAYPPPGDEAGHVNCRCSMVPIETGARLPPWWVAARCDEVFGVTSPALFYQLEQ